MKKLALESISYAHIFHLNALVKLMPHLKSIQINGHRYYYGSGSIPREFCSALPDHVKHLSFSIQNPYDMHQLRDSIRRWSSVNFQFVNYHASPVEMQLDWLNAETGYYACRLGQSSLSLWLDKVEQVQ